MVMRRPRGLEDFELSRIMSRFRGGPTRTPTRMPSRGGNLDMEARNANLRGGRMDAASAYGRGMGGGIADGPKQAIWDQVLGDLSGQGIYRDERGNWNIEGIERPRDTSLDIRDSAVAAMGGPEWTAAVGAAEPRYESTRPSAVYGQSQSRTAPGSSTSFSSSTRESPVSSITPPSSPALPAPGGSAPVSPAGLTEINRSLMGLPPSSPSMSVNANDRMGSPTQGYMYPGGWDSYPTEQTPPAPRMSASDAELEAMNERVANGIPGGGYAHPDSQFSQESRARSYNLPSPLTPPGSYPLPSPTTPPKSYPLPNQGPAPLPVIESPKLGGPAHRASLPVIESPRSIPAAPQQGPLPPSMSVNANDRMGTPPPTQGGVPGMIARGGQRVGSTTAETSRPQVSIAPPTQAAMNIPGTVMPARSAPVDGTQGRPGSPMAGYPVSPPPSMSVNANDRMGSPSARPGSPMQASQFPAQQPGQAPAGQAAAPRAMPPRPPTSFGTPGPTAIPSNQPAGLAGLGDRIASTVQGRIAGGASHQPLPGFGGSIRTAVEEMIRSGSQSAQPGATIGQPAMVGANDPRLGTGVGQTPTMGGSGAAPAAPGAAPGASPQAAPQQPGSTGKLGSYGNATIDQWDSAFIAAGNEFGVDPTLLKAMMDIETGGDGNYSPSQCRDDGTGVASCGPMQIKGVYHQSKCPSCDLSTTEGSIRMAAAILADGVNNQGYATHKDALFGIYFPSDDPNGTTQGSYGARVNELQAQMGAYQPGPPVSLGDPALVGANDPNLGGQQAGAIPGSNAQLGGGTVPVSPSGPFGTGSLNQEALMPGGANPSQGAIASPSGGPAGGPVPIDNAHGEMVMNSNLASGTGPNAEPVAVESQQTLSYLEGLFPGATGIYTEQGNFGFKDMNSKSLYCDYWDWNCQAHTGIDIPTLEPRPFNALEGGTVICAGAGSNNAPDTTRSGYSCNSYGDTDHGGIGNITIETANKAHITYGHSNASNYGVGQQVAAGQQLGISGGMYGDHIHLEVRLPVAADGGYVLVDPNLYFNGGYCDIGFCPY